MKFNLHEDVEYDLKSDLELISELTHTSIDDLSDFIDTSNIEEVYEYAWGNNIRINDIK